MNIGISLALQNMQPIEDSAPPVIENALLKEDADFLLLESGDFILKEG